MPEMRKFIVTEVRQVEVAANTAVDAGRIADKAFKEGQNSGGGLKTKEGLDGIWGDTRTRIRQTDLHVEED